MDAIRGMNMGMGFGMFPNYGSMGAVGAPMMGGTAPMGGCASCCSGGSFMAGMAMQQAMLMEAMLMMLMDLMLGTMGRGGNGFGGGGYGGGGAGSYGGPAYGSRGAGGAGHSPSGSVGAPMATGPVAPGVGGMLDHARSMLGMTERGNTSEIMKITGKSGINPATTPWCAAFAINMLKDHGVLDTKGLSNPNYCPTIRNWARDKGIYGQRGQYTPKPGDAILFDYNGDGTDDHIGIVESVENGKVHTIEGNASDSVKRNSYDLNSKSIDGYVVTGKPHR